MKHAITASHINKVFRGAMYGNDDIFTAATFRDFLHRNDIDMRRAIRATDGSRLIGSILFAQRSERAWLALMGVLPEYRRRGHGARLFGAAVADVIASGARTIEFEVVQRNHAAIAMYCNFGFVAIDELLVWARDARPNAPGHLALRPYDPSKVGPMMRGSAACWQREERSVALAGRCTCIGVEGAFAFVRMRAGNAVILDAVARDARSGHRLALELDARVRANLTLPNEPAQSPLSAALRDAGWRIVERQHRMMLHVDAKTPL